MLKTVAITSGSGGGNGTVTNVATGTGLTGGPITTTGTISLANTAVTAGTYGNASTVSQVTINAQGQVTNAVNVAISIANSAVTGLGTMATQNANAVVVTGGSINNTAIGNATANTGVFTTLTNTGTAYLGGASGNQSLQVNNVASAVNYAQIVGAVTGGSPTISAQGTDANVDLTYNAKGTGNHYFQSNGATNFRIAQGASIVNYAMVYGGATGSPPAFLVEGADANIQLRFLSKGTGACAFLTGGGVQALVSNTASAVNYLQLTGAATGAAPTISAQGSDTNISLKLTPKGTGGLWFTGPLLPNNTAGTSGQVLTSAGAGAVPTWTTASGATITDDTTTNAVRYVSFTAASSGSLSTLYTSSTKLKYNPSTGALTASSIIIAP